MQTSQAYLRQFGELVTNYATKFRRDIFWRTEVIIISILFFLCFANIVAITISFHYINLKTASVVIDSIRESIEAGSLNPTLTSESMLSKLNDIRNTYLLVVGAISIMVTLLFGYVVARIALTPTRTALSSQKQFISNIAHELRTPLSIIKANNEIMQFESRKPGADFLPLITSNIEELDRISGTINNLLTLNTLRYKEHIEFSSVNVSELLEDSVAKLDRLIQNKKLRVEMDIPPDLYAWGNKSGIAQIAINLIKNAINYTPEHGSIFISARSMFGENVEFEVKDTGIGIEEEKLNLIFEPFYQVDPSRSGHKGSGLGLAITSDLIKLHSGKISLKSNFRKGTSVRVQLPSQPKLVRGIRMSRKQREENEVVIDYSKQTPLS